LRAVQAIAPVEAGSRVLDAGCGDGVVLAWLAASGALPVGIDVARSMVRHCRERGLIVALQSMERLGFRVPFDWVFCIGSLEFAADPQMALQGFAACLRRGGKLALLFPERNWLGLLYSAYHRSHGVRIHLFTRPEMTLLLRKSGLHPRTWRRGKLSTACVAERLD
jgi:2-polyprenyl-3-methyl-5-hydroxy-6-metoxy-1,4-benzoquinol methylase